MKKILTAILLFTSTFIFSQESYDTLLARGKAEFKKDFDQQNYSVAVENLEKAVALKPKNAEAHYFLGYAYSRLNSKDGRSIINVKLDMIYKASKEFETVNELNKKYKGEKIILDPYSKITSEWGTAAMSYWYRNEKDSAIW